jgi:hypothetical protein
MRQKRFISIPKKSVTDFWLRVTLFLPMAIM